MAYSRRPTPLPSSDTPSKTELTSKLEKRRSLEGGSVYENTPSKSKPVENAVTQPPPQGLPPFAWPLENVGEIFASPDATWRRAASKYPTVASRAAAVIDSLRDFSEVTCA